MPQSSHRLSTVFRWPTRLVLLASLPGLFLAGFLLINNNQVQTGRLEQNLPLVARNLAYAVHQDFDRQTRLLSALSKSPALTAGDWKAFYNEANAALGGDPTWRIWVFDLSGQRIVDSSQPLGSTGAAVSIPRDIVDSVLSATGPVACAAITETEPGGAESSEQIISTCAAGPADSKATYILAIVTDPARMAALLTQYEFSRFETALLIDKAGQVIGVDRPDPATVPVGYKFPTQFVSKMTERDGGLLSGGELAAAPMKTGYYPIADSGWLVAISVDTSKLLKTTQRAATRRLIGGALACLLVLSIVVLVSRANAKNLARHVAAAEPMQPPVAPPGPDLDDRSRLIFNNVADLVSLNSADGRWIDISPSCRQLLGYEPQALVGQPMNAILDADSQMLPADLAAVLSSRNQTTKILRLRSRDGTSLWVEALMRPLFAPASTEAIGFVAAMRDISARKALEDRAERSTLLAEAANRAKSDFLASMSHELRTPLNAVLGFSQLLLDNPKMPLSERQREYIEYVIRGGNQLHALVSDLVDFVKTEAGTLRISLENIELYDVLNEASITLDPLARQKSVTVVVDQDSARGRYVRADRSRLLQVLINLGSNAIKYNRPGGEISISVNAARVGWLNISVQDTGFGIPDDRRSEVFEPFNRLDAETAPIEGTGIGLTIAQRLMEMMGGKIDFSSVAGMGSIFWVELPEIEPAEQIDA